MHKINIHPDTYLGSALVLFIVMILGMLSVYPGIFTTKKQASSCTEEAKVCADGSVVMRSGPACEFTPCLSGDKPLRPGIVEEPFEVPVKTVPVIPEKKSEAPKNIPSKKEVLCTMEAKMCSNGSFVGRVAPECDFAPCPDLTEYESDH